MDGDIRDRISAAIDSGDEAALGLLAGELFDSHIRALRDVGTGALADRRSHARFIAALAGMNRMHDHILDGGAPEDSDP